MNDLNKELYIVTYESEQEGERTYVREGKKKQTHAPRIYDSIDTAVRSAQQFPQGRVEGISLEVLGEVL